MHTVIVNISQTITDKANITIDSNIMAHVGFRLAYLETYSNDQLCHENSVSSNICNILSSIFHHVFAKIIVYPIKITEITLTP